MGMSKLKKFAVAGATALVGVVLLVTGFNEFRQSKKLQAEGKQVSGVVTDTDVQRGRRGRRSYYLRVNYKTEAGETFEARKSVSRSLFDEASEARTVPVVYLPADPAVVTFGKADTEFGGLIAGAVALVLGGVIGFGKSKDDEGTPASPADVEKELLADNSKYDDQQKAA
jgi:hypothetical protein